MKIFGQPTLPPHKDKSKSIMKLISTYDTLTDTVAGEPGDPISCKRIVPENDLDRMALAQIYCAQKCQDWSLENREIPYDIASFGTINDDDIDDEGFAKAVLYLQKAEQNFSPIDPLPETIDVFVYWLKYGDKIQSCWSIEAGEFNSAQFNEAGCKVVFK